MKYIRTKDKILPYYDESKTGKLDVVLQVFDGIRNDKVNETFDEIVLKQTDNVEELCDEFVLFRDNKPYAIVPNKGHNSQLAKDVWKDYRGAIWTDKGLIFVAKMNDEGELELL